MRDKKLTVTVNSGEYPIYITGGFGGLALAFRDAKLVGRRVLVLADTNTAALFGGEVTDTIHEFSSGVTLVEVKPGESSKSIETACEVYRECIAQKLDRTSVIVALGGGVVGDLAGFIASTFMRGVAFVQIPTTLLAQVDSSVGGKAAINFDGEKNLIGSFYQPKFVYSNINTFTTLPRREFISGMAEAIKHGLIRDESYLNFIIENKAHISNLSLDATVELVYGSCKIKSDIVLSDERENNIREILNFGHTFGHGIESASGFTIPHGHAVAIGCVAALTLSAKMGNISADEISRLKELYQYFGLPCVIDGYNANTIFDRMKRDKKSKSGAMTVILLRRIGEAYSDSATEENMIRECINAITKENKACILYQRPSALY